MTKGQPKKDGSGRGVRANRGRGGCVPTRKVGQGRLIPREMEEEINIEGLEGIW